MLSVAASGDRRGPVTILVSAGTLFNAAEVLDRAGLARDVAVPTRTVAGEVGAPVPVDWAGMQFRITVHGATTQPGLGWQEAGDGRPGRDRDGRRGRADHGRLAHRVT